MKKVLFIITAVTLGIFAYGTVRPAQPASAEISVVVACQYPNRSTNPSGGCDNTDPCDPIDAAKGGSGECASARPAPSSILREEPTNYEDSGGK